MDDSSVPTERIVLGVTAEVRAKLEDMANAYGLDLSIADIAQDCFDLGFHLKAPKPEKDEQWQLDMRLPSCWTTMRNLLPSANVAKSHARRWGNDNGNEFRIYSQYGKRLEFINDPNSGERMKWLPGNLKSRDEQDQ